MTKLMYLLCFTLMVVSTVAYSAKKDPPPNYVVDPKQVTQRCVNGNICPYPGVCSIKTGDCLYRPYTKHPLPIRD
ncbi:unnamed protein product [Callosobruchus maculatus]|uniref:Uncharacterized protein n=1 Tax=Callosobruchus maculatus TaxID=64391 RepID=A0A653BTI5_CALMS|nr:unnamed protein product [Callosobruchus maculatus]